MSQTLEAPAPPARPRSAVPAARPAAAAWITACAAGAVLLLLGLLARPVVTGRIPVYWDLGGFHLPLRDAYAKCLRAGEPFDWLPAMHNGVFITGEGELGGYHPLHLALYRFLPLPTAFALEAYLHYPFLVLGMFLFLRRHAGPAGALFAGLAYAFCANNVAHGFHVNYVAVLSHLPWLLWLQESVVLGSGAARWRAAGAVALLTGSQVLLGHPQVLSYSLLAQTLYALFLAAGAARPWSGLAAWAGAELLGAAVGGVQLLATVSFLAGSNRGTFDPLFGSLPPAHFVQLLVPSVLVGHAPGWSDETMYAGAVPLLLAAWALTCLWRRRSSAEAVPQGAAPRRVAAFAVVLMVLAAWLATGKHGRLYLLQTHLPLVGQLRAPARYVNLVDFAIAVLGGLAFGRLVAGARTGRPRAGLGLLLPWAVAAAAVTAALLFRAAFPAGGSGFDKRFLSAAACFAGAALLLTLAARGTKLATAALVVLAAWDLFHFSLCHPQWGLSLWKETPTLSEYLAAAPMPPAGGEGRLLHHAWEGTRTLLLGTRLVNGYRGGIEPRKRLDYTHADALRLSGAAWYCELNWGGPQPIEGLQAVGGGWYRVPDPLPRVRLVSRARPSDDPAADLAGIDLVTEALTARPVDLDGGTAGSATLADERPGRLRVETRSPGRQLLVVSESFDPGWRVAVDGGQSEPERVNGDFLGCVVGPGRHAVEFTFAPPCLFGGRLLSASAAALALLLCAAGMLRRRPAAAVAPAPCPEKSA
jgi:hypothetical protein